MTQLDICFCLLSHAAGYAFHVADYQLIERHAKLPQPAFRFDQDQFRYNEENSIVQTVEKKQMIYDLSSKTAVLYTGLHKPGRTTLEIRMRTYFKELSDHSQLQLCQDLRFHCRTRIVLILAIVANKMAFSLTTMNLDYKVLG